MTIPYLRRKTLPLLFAVALAAAAWPVAASPQKQRATQAAAPSPLGFVGRSWAFLQSLWSAEGCRLDPNGRCFTGTDTGCRIDPNGVCSTGSLPRADTDTGCRLDPDGRCHV
jgi:hypothetical protein